MVTTASEDGEPSPRARAAAHALFATGRNAHYRALDLDKALAALREAVREARGAGIPREDVLDLIRADLLTALQADVLLLARTMIRQEYKGG